MGPGTSVLRLRYVRPFEKNAAPAKTFQITVTATPAGEVVGGATGQVTLGDINNDSTVRIERGGVLTLRLSANPSTGYGWQIAQSDAAGAGRIKPLGGGGPTYENAVPARPGSGGFEVFRFQAQGSGALTLRYARRGEKERPARPNVPPRRSNRPFTKLKGKADAMFFKHTQNRRQAGFAAAAATGMAVTLLLAGAGAAATHAAGQTTSRIAPTADQTTLPAGTVIALRLDAPLSSKTARPGDPFTATVRSSGHDGGAAAGLPDGTRVQGVLTESLPAANGVPGVLDMSFRRVSLPGSPAAATQPIQGVLVALGAQNVQRDPSSGLLTATTNNNAQRAKWIGVGAAGGAAISALSHRNRFVDTLLGAAGGSLLAQRLKNNDPGDVNLRRGTPFGLLLTQPFTYVSPQTTIGVVLDGRPVAFGNAKPFARAGGGGVALIPLDPVSRAARFDYTFDPGQQMIRARGGALRLSIGSDTVTVNNRSRRLSAPAEVRAGVVYVPLGFLALASGGSATMSADGRTAVLSTVQGLATALAGTYLASGPAADAPGLRMTLYLNEDNTCTLMSDYVGKATVIETGTWSARSSANNGNANGSIGKGSVGNGNTRVTVMLTASNPGGLENNRITFTSNDDTFAPTLVATPDSRFPPVTFQRL